MLYKTPNDEQIKETYLKYIESFRQHDWEKVEKFVADNIYFYWGTRMPPIVSKVDFINFFKTASEYWDEKPVPNDIQISIPILKAWIVNTIHVTKDWSDSPFNTFGMQPRAGDIYEVSGYVNYVFNEDGQIAVIIDSDYNH